MAQNLETYTGVDPSGVMTQTGAQCDYVGIARDSGSTYLYYDMGAGVLDASVGLSYIGNISSRSGNILLSNNIFSDAPGDHKGLADASKSFIVEYYAGSISSFVLRLYVSGALLDGDFAAKAPNADVLRVWSRSGTTMTCVVYNGATIGSGIHFTLSVTHATMPASFQYHMAVTNYQDGVGSTSSTGYTKDYIFTGLPVTAVARFPKGMIVNKGGSMPQHKGGIVNA